MTNPTDHATELAAALFDATRLGTADRDAITLAAAELLVEQAHTIEAVDHLVGGLTTQLLGPTTSRDDVRKTLLAITQLLDLHQDTA